MSYFQSIATIFGCVAGVVAGVVPSPNPARCLTFRESVQIVAGDCQDTGCTNVTCKVDAGGANACTISDTICTAAGTSCQKISKNNFAKCGDKGSKPKFNCTATPDNMCVKIKKGKQEADGSCPEANCKDDSTCGDAWLKCVATACE